MYSLDFEEYLWANGVSPDSIADIKEYFEKRKFFSIPKHLSKDYKKFQYSIVQRGGTARKFGGSLNWLYDTGLLMAMLEDGSQEDIIDGNLGIYKGAIYENIIADIFSKSGKKL